MKHLVLGGARSGKSRFAEQRALNLQQPCFYVATGWAGDDEMSQRIAMHQQQRNKHWQLVEEPLSLATALQNMDGRDHIILVDCLTLWLSNTLQHEQWPQQKQALFNVLPQLQADIIFVSNEVGSGIVPLGELSRTFVDQAGWLNQTLAQVCERVTLVVAGLELHLKPKEHSL